MADRKPKDVLNFFFLLLLCFTFSHYRKSIINKFFNLIEHGGHIVIDGEDLARRLLHFFLGCLFISHEQIAICSYISLYHISQLIVGGHLFKRLRKKNGHGHRNNKQQ